MTNAPAPRRILMVIPTLGQGGAEVQLAHLAHGLAARGDRVRVACLLRAALDRSWLEEAGVEIVELGAMSRRGKAARLPALVRLAREADVVHCGLWDASLYGRLAAIAARRPVTVADHSADRSMQRSADGAPRARLIGWHHRLLSPFTAATVACARSQLPLLRREGVAPERIVLVPNGVPVEALRRAARTAGVTRRDLGVPEEAALIAQVGRLTPEKDQAATVEAVGRLRDDVGDVHAVFVGDGADRSGPELAHRLGAEWAHFIGGRDDVAGILALADLAVLPSRVDTLPMAALEALAVGVPQVTSDVGDLPSVVGETGAGVSVPAGDATAFTDACRLLLTDPEARRNASEAAARAAWRWDVGAMVDAYSRMFDAAIEGAGRTRTHGIRSRIGR